MPERAGWSVERAQRELRAEQRYEIDRGELLVLEPPGFHHGAATVRAGSVLHRFVEEGRLGLVTGEAGFWLERAPDTLRAPDLAFVGHDRLRRIADPDAFAEVPPDLAVEVVSPSDRPGELQRKAAQMLALGVRSVWVLDPRRRTLTRHLADGSARVYADPADAVEDPVLPGFRCALAELLPPQP